MAYSHVLQMTKGRNSQMCLLLHCDGLGFLSQRISQESRPLFLTLGDKLGLAGAPGHRSSFEMAEGPEIM